MIQFNESVIEREKGHWTHKTLFFISRHYPVSSISSIRHFTYQSQQLGPIQARFQTMLFYSFFKSLVGKEVTVELKNDLGITGMLHSVDQYLNIKLQDIYVTCPG